MRKVVVVGGGISGLAAAYQLLTNGYDVSVIEASSAIGGKISTVEIAGVPIDGGPDAFLVREPEMKELCSSLGIADELVACLLYTSPSPRDRQKSRMPSSA